jgi:hypothetical protein
MSTFEILNLSRTPLRIGDTNVAYNTPTVVDTDDPNVQRDLRTKAHRYTIVPDSYADGPSEAVCAAPTAEGTNARTVSIQLNDRAGAALAEQAVVGVYVSTDAGGNAPGDGSLTIALTAGTDGALISSDDSGATFVSEADGDLDVVLTDSADGAGNVYLHVTSAGKIIGSSAVIAFADDTP